MKTVIVLNGPPRCGKDTLSGMLAAEFGAVELKFAAILKRMVHQAFGLHDVPVDHFEAVKDQPQDTFFGRTPREAYIAFSETFIKPLYGQKFFGTELARQIAGSGAERFVVSDGGFPAEMEPLYEVARVELVHVKRPGCDFSNDSRDWLPHPDLELHNVGDLADLRKCALHLGDASYMTRKAR